VSQQVRSPWSATWRGGGGLRVACQEEVVCSSVSREIENEKIGRGKFLPKKYSTTVISAYCCGAPLPSFPLSRKETGSISSQPRRQCFLRC
jgi:hypothetical protein